MTSEIRTEFLIVGAGPAGAGLGSFLGQNGMLYYAGETQVA